MGTSVEFTNEILGLFSGVAVNPQSSYALDFSETQITPEGTGTWFVSGNMPGYAPYVYDCAPTHWQRDGSRKIFNKQTIFFPAAITSDWTKAPQAIGLRRHTGGVPAGTADFFGNVNMGRLVQVGDRLKIAPGGLVLEIPASHTNISDAFAAKILGLLLGENIPAPLTFTLHFGKKDPKIDGNIQELTEAGYAPIEIECNGTNWDAPATRQTTNLVEFDHTYFWTAAAPVTNIVSAEIKVDNIPWLRGKLTESASLNINDNMRIPVGNMVLGAI